MCAREQAKAWAYRAIAQETGAPSYGLLTEVAGHVKKTGGGNPSVEAVRKLYEKIDGDTKWFPGKTTGGTRGRPLALNAAKRRCVAASAMAIKSGGGEPTYASIVAQCPRAVVNPRTKVPVNKTAVYDILRSDCYDKTPSDPWCNRPRLSKTALSDPLQARRLAWGQYIERLQHSSAWYYKRLVWTDLCNSILPKTAAKATEQALARKGQRGWMSSGSQLWSPNLRGNRTCLKQKSWDATRIWWAPVLMRGKFHIIVLPENFPGETPAGAAVLAASLQVAVAARFPRGDPPNIVMVDRGKGFYAIANGLITRPFHDALSEHGLKDFMGGDASLQPGSLPELMLHETAVAWVRRLLVRSTPKSPWLESRQDYALRLRAAARKINADFDVDSLCRAFPRRVAQLVAQKGDKLRQ